MGQVHSVDPIPEVGKPSRESLIAACQDISSLKNQAIINLLLETLPHYIFSNLPRGTRRCYIPDSNCLECFCEVVTLHCTPLAKIPYHAAEQWVGTDVTAEIPVLRRTKSMISLQNS